MTAVSIDAEAKTARDRGRRTVERRRRLRPPSTGSPPSTAPRERSASPATTLGGAWGGWRARRASPATASVAFDVVTADGEARGRRRERARPLLGAPRGWRRPRRRDGPGDGADRDARGLRGLIDVADGAGRDDRAGVAGADGLGARGALSTLKLIRFPPLPDVPDPLRGRALVAVTVVYEGDEAAGAELLAPLRSSPTPTST